LLKESLLPKISKLYTFNIFFFILLAIGIDFLLWNHLINFHKLAFENVAFVLSLSIGYYCLLFGLTFLILSTPYIRYLAFAIPLAHLGLLISENLHFYQYAAFINTQGLNLFLQNRGEVTHLLKNGLGHVQVFYIIKVTAATSTWLIPLIVFLTAAKDWLPKVRKKEINPSLQHAFVSLICLSGFLGIYVTQLSAVSDKEVNSVRVAGSMGSHLFLAWKGYFKPKTKIASEKFIKPESIIDPTTIPQQKSNMILILMDSIRADHLPDYGYKRNTTPFLHSMKEELIRIEYCYAQANATEKSFPSLLLSKYPYFYRRNKNWGVFDYIEKNGYSVGVSSSMDLNWADIIRMFRHKVVKHTFHAGDMPEEFYIWGYTRSSQFNYGVDDGYNVKQVSSWIDKLPQPFYLIVHFHSAHYSYEVPKKYDVFLPVPKRRPPPWKPMVNAYNNAIYRVDDAVKELFETLRKNDVLDNSVVAITSDHGEAFGEHPGSVYHQTAIYESQIRVPLFFYFGKKLSRARHLVYKGKDRITGLVDVLPTLAKSVGLPLSPEFQGVPVWGNSNKTFEAMITFLTKQEYAIRLGKWKFMKNIHTKRKRLYDLEKDPGERNNVAKAHPELVKKLESMDKPIR
ncbi:MAG: sulfatase-like hydrolase/transferase, partial [Spirochaetota bacterium]